MSVLPGEIVRLLWLLLYGEGLECFCPSQDQMGVTSHMPKAFRRERGPDPLKFMWMGLCHLAREFFWRNMSITFLRLSEWSMTLNALRTNELKCHQAKHSGDTQTYGEDGHWWFCWGQRSNRDGIVHWEAFLLVKGYKMAKERKFPREHWAGAPSLSWKEDLEKDVMSLFFSFSSSWAIKESQSCRKVYKVRMGGAVLQEHSLMIPRANLAEREGQPVIWSHGWGGCDLASQHWKQITWSQTGWVWNLVH